MNSTTPPSSERETSDPFYAALRIFGFVVLALMLVSIAYSGWIALVNWGDIGV